jgi:hypothetical protein
MTEELIEETKKNIESDPKKAAFKDIFKIDEDELMDFIESHHDRGGLREESLEEELKEDSL